MALIGYARVSILEEETWLQHDALEAAGCKRVFTDRSSGGVEERPELARLYDHLREGDTIVVTRLDRLGRSLRDLVDTIGALAERGVGLRSLDASLDTTGAKGKAVVAVCAALAEFELDVVRERTALAAVGVREPREQRLGAFVEAARSLPSRRAAAEPAPGPPTELLDAADLDLADGAAPPRRGAAFVRRPRPRREAAAPATATPVGRSRRVTVAPAPAPAAAEPVPAPDGDFAAAPRRRGRRRVLLGVQILAAVGAGAAALHVGQSGANSAIVLGHTTANADVVVGVPERWRRSSSDLAMGSLGLRDAIVLRPGSIGGAMIMTGLSPATGASLLPAAVTDLLDRVPEPASVRLDRMTALRYGDLRVDGLSRRLTVFATPTGRGVLIFACLAPRPDGAAVRPVCDRVARSLRLTRARALPPGPSVRYQTQLNRLVGALDATRATERARLASAREAPQQAQRAERLADAYAQARATGAAQDVSPREAAAQARILAALGAASAAYARMAEAARAVSVSGYERARAQVGFAERRVRAALTALRALGYRIAAIPRSGGS